MKKVLLLLLAVSLTMTSCKKDDTEEQPEATAGSGKITLSLDGGDLVDFPIDNASSMGGKIYLNGLNGNDALTIIVTDPTLGPDTYTNDELGIVYSENSLAVFDDVTNVTGEQYIITEHDQSSHHIVGSFQVTYNDNQDGTPHAAQGTFDVTYVVIN
jgi:hypothetical protein